MDELRIAVCEDNSEECTTLLSLIRDSGMETETKVFTTGEELLENYRQGSYDLIFMDIYMEGISGVETIKRIRERDADVPVAFTTTSTDYALESYRLDVVKYIEKPVKAKAVQDMLQLALLKRGSAPGLTIFVESKRETVPFGQILYVEQQAHDLIFYLSDGRQLRTKGRLDEIEDSFPSVSFMRCHKSYLTNLGFVTALDTELMSFRMVNNHNVYIRRESIKKAKAVWETYMFDAVRRLGGEADE